MANAPPPCHASPCHDPLVTTVSTFRKREKYLTSTRSRCLLTVLVAVLSLMITIVLTSCIVETPTADTPHANEVETTVRTIEEIVQANTATLLAHFDEIELTEEYASRRGRAMSAAWALSEATDALIVSVSSQVRARGAIDVTVTTEGGKSYSFSMGIRGVFYTIEDEDGNVVYAVIE